jgi:putative restriction endonuclease
LNFWWVNHKQTFRQEFRGRYIWSPKAKRSGHRNPFYETMREVCPGDVVYSFAYGAVQGFGLARTHCYTSPRPDEFGRIGESWDAVGWRVDVDFVRFVEPVRPSMHLDAVVRVLPDRYSPIDDRGRGRQHVYLARIPKEMALVIATLGSPDLVGVINGLIIADKPVEDVSEPQGLFQWEERESQKIADDSVLPRTEKEALMKARRGQGLFRERVARIERRCRITRVENPEHLIASHIKPWRESDNRERLTDTNGLMLTPSIDHLFDRGFISFEDSGEVLLSPVADLPSLERMGVETQRVVNVGGFNEGQRSFLHFHRTGVFLRSETDLRRRSR